MSMISPAFQVKRFNCPFCNAFADQHWSPTEYKDDDGYDRNTSFWISKCKSCNRLAVWWNKRMVFPDIVNVPLPNVDMPEKIKIDFEEARTISNTSPRGACALLRLCVEKLCVHLGETSGDLNAKIGELVKKGLRPEIQQSLDAVRVIGNETVHPGELDIRDNPEIANALFSLVNLIVQTMITDPRTAREIFDKIPQGKKDGITQRDASTPL